MASISEFSTGKGSFYKFFFFLLLSQTSHKTQKLISSGYQNTGCQNVLNITLMNSTSEAYYIAFRTLNDVSVVPFLFRFKNSIFIQIIEFTK